MKKIAKPDNTSIFTKKDPSSFTDTKTMECL